jgi:hypothetical protein
MKHDALYCRDPLSHEPSRLFCDEIPMHSWVFRSKLKFSAPRTLDSNSLKRDSLQAENLTGQYGPTVVHAWEMSPATAAGDSPRKRAPHVEGPLPYLWHSDCGRALRKLTETHRQQRV